jgi:hypothetical protein
MADDAGAAASSIYAGPPTTFIGTSTGCYNATSSGSVTINQFIECSQSTTACVCWAWKFCCWSNATSSCVACPGSVNENTKLCYPATTGACTTCKPGDFMYDNPSGYVDVNTSLCNNKTCSSGQLRDCIPPSTAFGDQQWN